MRTLRWLLMLPAATLAALLVTFPLHWLVIGVHRVGFNPLSALAPDTLERLLYAFGVPYAFVLASAYVAPRFRARAGAVVAVGLGVLFAVLLTWALGQENLEVVGPAWARVAAPVLVAAGLIKGFFVTRRADEWGW